MDGLDLQSQFTQAPIADVLSAYVHMKEGQRSRDTVLNTKLCTSLNCTAFATRHCMILNIKIHSFKMLTKKLHNILFGSYTGGLKSKSI